MTDVFTKSSNDIVNKQWRSRPDDERYTSLSDMLSDKLAIQNDSRAIVLNSSDIVASAEHNDVVIRKNGAGNSLSFSHWSFSQLANLAGAPSSYLRTLPANLVADNLNHGFKSNNFESKILFRNSTRRARAITSPTYGRIHDSDIIRSVMRFAGNGNGDADWRVPGAIDWSDRIYRPAKEVTKDNTTLYASDRDMFIFLTDDQNPIEIGTLPNGNPDILMRGFGISNSEEGAGTCKAFGILYRGPCANRILWGIEHFAEINIRHTKFAPDRFAAEMITSLDTYRNQSTLPLLEAVSDVRAVRIEQPIEFLSGLGLTKRLAVQIGDRHMTEEGRPIETAWDAVQGITAVARDIPFADERLRLEGFAEKILNKIAA